MTTPTTAPGVLAVGPRDAPAMVFVHGTRVTGGVWAAQLADLGGEFRAIAFDLPGHGTRAPEPFTLEAGADALAATIREYAAGPAVVVGLSLGGYVAMALAAREPGLVRGLVLSGATAEPTRLGAIPFLAYAALIDGIDPARLERWSAWYFRRRFPPALAEPVVAGRFWSKGGAQAVRALVGERFIPRLAAYPGPTLIVNGEYDILFRLFVPSFARAARNPRRVRLAGARHLANLDRPAAFSEVVRRFARSLPEA